MSVKKIALGSAQFGLKYGIANRIGKLTEKEVFAVLDYAHKKGIDTLDTAYSYGESEQIIGKYVSQSAKSFNIISKLPHLDNYNPSVVDSYCLQTLTKLKQSKIYGYLVHKFDDIHKYEDLWDRLESLKQKDFADTIGVSIYKVEELEYLLDENIHFDILQVPYNILDQRFNEYFPILRKMNVEIYTRSVFLQGLFFLEMDKIIKNFQSAKDRIEKLRQISSRYSIPLHALCLCFALLNPLIDKVIIGVDSLEQLKQDIDSIEYLDRTDSIYESLKSLEFHDEEIILPYNWK